MITKLIMFQWLSNEVHANCKSFSTLKQFDSIAMRITNMLELLKE